MINKKIGIGEDTRTRAINEFEQLLLSTGRTGIEYLVRWLKVSTFYEVPASERVHGNFWGGLLCHSLNTYHNAIERNKSKNLPKDSVVLASLLHDMCKCGAYQYINGVWVKNKNLTPEGHGRRSLTMLLELGLDLTEEEQIAIRWHMKHTDSDLKDTQDVFVYKQEYEVIKSESHPLLDIIFDADYKASKEELIAQKARLYCPLSYITTEPYSLRASEPSPFPFTTSQAKHTGLSCVGIGNICMNPVIRRDYTPSGSYNDTTVLQEVGGSVANVTCNLAHLGWNTYPMARLGQSSVAHQIICDLERYGTDTRLITTSEDGGTYLKVSLHSFDADGVPENKFGQLVYLNRRCDVDGNYTQNARLVPVRKLDVDSMLSQLDFTPTVLFYDSGTAGCKETAKVLKNKGSVLFFEPTDRYDPYLSQCIGMCDIFKFSCKNITDLRGLNIDWSQKLVIQTLGADGARFNLKNQGWVAVPPVVNDYVIDTEGAGDITTAAFLNTLAELGTLSVADMTADMVYQALSEAMKYGSYSTSFLGAKGMWYNDPNCHL